MYSGGVTTATRAAFIVQLWQAVDGALDNQFLCRPGTGALISDKAILVDCVQQYSSPIYCTLCHALGWIIVIDILCCFSGCVSVCRQQPRADVDGDPLQRDDLHPAWLHPSGFVQNTVPGGDGEPWELRLWERYRWASTEEERRQYRHAQNTGNTS